jgi:hypothetical protein
MNLLHVDSLCPECVPSDPLALYQAGNLCHCNTQEPSCRSKKMSYANSSTTEEQWMFIKQ